MDTKTMLLNLLLLLSLLPFSIPIDTLTINQSITDSKLLLSKEGTFALGFFSPSNSRFKYLGIWYNKLPGQTVVWVANRDSPINNSSGVLSINPDGNLVLYTNHGQNFPLWSTNVSVPKATGAYFAQLLDSGNLVLFQNNESKRIVWQSFDYPTDTLLPGMKLGLDLKNGLDRYLTSWRSIDDPRTGNYKHRLNPTGSPQFFLYKDLTRYWRGSPWPWPPGVYSVRPDLHNYTFTNNQYEIYASYLVDDESIITRTLVHYAGLLHQLIWDNSSQQWKETWSAPKFIDIYGHCGAYSISNANNVDNFECMCLPGYVPKSLKNWNLRDGSGGCARKRQQTTSMCRNGEGFVKVAPVKFPDTSVAALMNITMSSTECEHLCKMNCSCVAFASLDIERKGVGCLTWYGELMDTLQRTEGRELYVRVDAIELAEHATKTRGFLKKKGMLAVLLLSVALPMFLILMFAYLCLSRKREAKVKKKWTKKLLATLVANELVETRQPPDLQIFDQGTLSAATNNFSPSNKLGQGGFGSVYKGQLFDGQEIAIKRLSQNSGQGIEEFKNEVMLIARLQHRNLVKLLGCCIQGEEKMLIYEYLPNRSLDCFIFDARRRSLLDWRKRFDIIVGIARGILYLHHDSRLRIIHRDLKTSNVLLDAEMKPKISDFGIARIFKGDQVQDRTSRVVGTYGYMSPEYAVFGKFSLKSDVFSFGVILLEIISGKKSNTSYEKDPSLSLIGHVWDLWREDRVLDIVDSLLTESYLAPEVIRCIQIGLLCVQEDAIDRPTMLAVVLMLNGVTSLPCPKQPAFVFRRNCNDMNQSTPAEAACSLNEVTITKVEGR